MLTYELAPNLSGPVIFGFAEKLHAVHEILHDVNERSPVIRGAQGGRDGTAQKTRTKRGRWTPAQRQQIVAASHVARASINEVAARFGILGGFACTVATKTSPQLTATAKSIGVPFDLSTMISFYWSSFVA